MNDKRVTKEQLKQELMADFDRLVEKVATAMNEATPGRIIADSEMPVYNASTEFRQQVYQHAVDLIVASHEGTFSPSAEPGQDDPVGQ